MSVRRNVRRDRRPELGQLRGGCLRHSPWLSGRAQRGPGRLRGVSGFDYLRAVGQD
jgi:hypothetical protein